MRSKWELKTEPFRPNSGKSSVREHKCITSRTTSNTFWYIFASQRSKRVREKRCGSQSSNPWLAKMLWMAIKETTWENVVDVVKRARSSSWIKQNSVQSFNKRCPQLLRRLWKLLKIMGMKRIIEKRQQDKPVKNNILPKCRGLNFSVVLYWQGDWKHYMANSGYSMILQCEKKGSRIFKMPRTYQCNTTAE